MSAPASSASTAPQAAVRVPLWVVGIMLAGLAAAIADMPSFVATLDDAVGFTRIGNALDRGESSSAAIEALRRLEQKFPDGKPIKIKLFAAQLLGGDSLGAGKTLDELKAGKLDNSEIKELNGWIQKAGSRADPPQPPKD